MQAKAPVIPKSELSKFLTVRNIALALGVSEKKVHNWLNRADVILPSRPLLPKDFTQRSPRVVDKADFEQFKANHKELIKAAQERR